MSIPTHDTDGARASRATLYTSDAYHWRPRLVSRTDLSGAFSGRGRELQARNRGNPFTRIR